MRDDLGVEEFIEDVGTRVRSINRYEVTSYQVLVLSRGQRCLPPRCSPDGMLCPLLSAGDLRGPRSTVDSLEAPLEERGGKAVGLHGLAPTLRLSSNHGRRGSGQSGAI